MTKITLMPAWAFLRIRTDEAVVPSLWLFEVRNI